MYINNKDWIKELYSHRHFKSPVEALNNERDLVYEDNDFQVFYCGLGSFMVRDKYIFDVVYKHAQSTQMPDNDRGFSSHYKGTTFFRCYTEWPQFIDVIDYEMWFSVYGMQFEDEQRYQDDIERAFEAIIKPVMAGVN